MRWVWLVLVLGACASQSTIGPAMTIQTLAPLPATTMTTLPVPTAPLLDLELVECAPLGAVGTFTNRTAKAVSVLVDVRYFALPDKDGTVVWTEGVPLADVAPGEVRLWGSHSYGRVFGSCDATLAAR